MPQYSKILLFLGCFFFLCLTAYSNASFDEIHKYARQLNDEGKIGSYTLPFKKFISCFEEEGNKTSTKKTFSVFGTGTEAQINYSRKCEPVSPKEVIDLVVFVDLALKNEIITVSELKIALEKVSNI